MIVGRLWLTEGGSLGNPGWPGGAGQRGDGGGGDPSAARVYIRVDAALEVGSNVEFEIVLPPEVTGAKENVTVQCKGRVVRTDEPATGGSRNPPEARGVA